MFIRYFGIFIKFFRNIFFGIYYLCIVMMMSTRFYSVGFYFFYRGR